MKLNNELAAELLNVVKTAPEVERIIRNNDYSPDVSKMGTRLLNDAGWKSDDFWKFIDDSHFNDNLFEASLPYLNFKDISKERAFNLIRKLEFNWKIIELFESRIPELDENELIQLMRSTNSIKIHRLCSPLINFKTKTQDELWDLYKTRFYVNSPATLEIASLLEDKDRLYTLIDDAVETRSASQTPLIQLCAKKLEFSKLPEKELFKLATKHADATFLNPEIIKYIKDPYMLITLANNTDLITDAINQVNDNDDLIMLLLKKSPFAGAAYRAAIPKLKSEQNIDFLWDSKSTDEEISKLALAHINFAGKDEAELAKYIKRFYFGNDACIKAKPYLHFENKSDQEVIEFLNKTGYRETACAVFLPLMGLEKKSPAEIFELLKNSNFNENVGQVLIEYIDDKKTIFDIASQGGHSTKFWIKKFLELIPKMEDKELSKILESFRYNTYVNRSVIPFLGNAKVILDLLSANGYDEQTSKIALKRLRELK